MSAQLTCRICSAPTNYAHLGINSCRSCAEFYKRAVASAKSFVCRDGNGKCAINPKDSQNCRGCRFEKCKQLGMRLDGQKTGRSDVEPQSLEPSTSAPAKDPLVYRITIEYLASMERRRINEMTLRPTSLHRHVKADVPGEDFMLCTWTFLMDCLKMSVGEYIQFASTCFPEFAALSLEDQRLMLRHFASRLYLTEGQCGTYKKFGSYDGPYYMATMTTVYDSRNFEFFVAEESPASCSELVKQMSHYSDRGQDLLGPTMMKSQFTDVEFAVLFALPIWQFDPDQNFPDHIVALSDTVRRRLFESLKEYYRQELKLEDYSVRLGNLITFAHTIQECTNLLDEQMQTFNLAGLLSSDVPFLQMVTQIPY